MLKPYRCIREYKIDDGKWVNLDINFALLEEDGSNYHPRFPEETALTFDEVWKSAQTFKRIYADRTSFRKRRRVWLCDMSHNDPVQVLDGECNQISFHDEREEARYLTLKDLMERFPSEIVIKYLKDNGLNACPML